jgi:hypothetical protein
VPPHDAERWLDILLSIKLTTAELAAAIVQIGARVDDPLRDLGEERRARALTRLRDANVDRDALRPLEEVVPMSPVDVNRVFGEPLPRGLSLVLSTRS